MEGPGRGGRRKVVQHLKSQLPVFQVMGWLLLQMSMSASAWVPSAATRAVRQASATSRQRRARIGERRGG